MKAIYKREMFAYFTSPIGYLVLAFALCVSGALFVYTNVMTVANSSNAYLSTSFVSFFSLISYVLILLVPLITMHLWAEERKNKTDQLLLTSSVSVSSIILGKYFACLSLFAINVAIMLIYPFTMSFYGTVIWSNVFMLFFGYFLMGSALLAVGLFVSTMTDSQIVSALITFAIILLMVLVEVFVSSVHIEVISNIIEWFSVFARFDKFVYGVIDISTLIYYISFSGLFVFLSVMSVQKKRWS